MAERLIDASELREIWLRNGLNECVYDTNAVLNTIDLVPTIDAVRVVRCHECMHGGRLWREHLCDNPKSMLSSIKPDDFCSYGERKDGAAT